MVVSVALGATFGVASAAFFGVLEPLLVRLGDGSGIDRVLGTALLVGPGLVLVAATGAAVLVVGWLLLRLDVSRVGRIVAEDDMGAVLAASTCAIAAAAGAAIGTALNAPLGSEFGAYAAGAVVFATESITLKGPVIRNVDLWVIFSIQSLVIAVVTSAAWSLDGVGIGIGLPLLGATYGVLVGPVLVMCRKSS